MRKKIIKHNFIFLDHLLPVCSSCFRANLKYFIQKLTPLAEELGFYLAIHPDDPPRALLGLPRVVSTSNDVKELLG